MGESVASVLFARRRPGGKLFAFFEQHGDEDNRISGAHLACKSFRKTKLSKELSGALRTVKKKKYSLNENAERLSKALTHERFGDAAEMVRRQYIRSAADLHALRSFAWTIGEYRKQTGTEYENLSEKELQGAAETVIAAGYLNYRGGSHFPGLCSQPDKDVFFLPEGIDKGVKTEAGTYGSTASLNRLRMDLIRLKPVVENIAMALLVDTVDGACRDCFARVLSAWCVLALSATEPFFMTDGPKSLRLPKVRTAEAEKVQQVPETEGDYLIAEIDGEMVRIPYNSSAKEDMYDLLRNSALSSAELVDTESTERKLSDFGEIDFQVISKRLFELQEDEMVANNDPGRERTVEELIAEMMGTALQKASEPAPAPAPAPAPVEPEWVVSTNNSNSIDPGWDATPVAPAQQAAPVPEPAPFIPTIEYVAPEPMPYIPPQPTYVAPEPTYVAPEPMPYIPPQPAYVAPEPMPYIPPQPAYVAPEPIIEPDPVIPEPVVVPEPVVIPTPVVTPEPVVVPEPAPVVPEPVAAPEPAPAPEPVKPVSTIPDITPAGAPTPAPSTFETNQASQTEVDEHEAAVRRRMREILEQNKKKQQEKDEVRRQIEERRLEVARKQEQRRQEILAKRRADYDKLLAEQEEMKKIVEENKNAIMGDRKRKRMDAQRRIDEIEDIILKEYLDLKRGTNDYHTGLTQEL